MCCSRDDDSMLSLDEGFTVKATKFCHSANIAAEGISSLLGFTAPFALTPKAMNDNFGATFKFLDLLAGELGTGFEDDRRCMRDHKQIQAQAFHPKTL